MTFKTKGETCSKTQIYTCKSNPLSNIEMSVPDNSRRHSLLDLFQRTNTQDQPNASSTPAKLKAIDQLL